MPPRFSHALRIVLVILPLFAAYVWPSSPVEAKARLIAVINLRSTPSAHAEALRATQMLARKLSEISGWDAKVVDPHGKPPADAAAAIGAEIYVVGQYLAGAPATVTGAAISVATDEHINDFSYAVAASGAPPTTFAAENLLAHASTQNSPSSASQPTTLSIPSGQLISVEILSDIGSRISQEGQAFAVVTTEDFYYKGHLILPKGSPGYGVITHLKRAGNFHAGGELNFTVKRLVTPSKTDVLVETNGPTADADKTTEHNGNAFGQYLLWGVGMFAKRGNDILIKKGTMFHVSTTENSAVPVAPENAQPANLDPALAPDLDSRPDASAFQTTVSYKFTPPLGWSPALTTSPNAGVQSLGSWRPPIGSNARISLVAQLIPPNMSADEFIKMTVSDLQRAMGKGNVHGPVPQRICNDTQDAWYVESTASIGDETTAEQVLAVSDQQSYIATYLRLRNTVEDPSARRSLESLCVGV